MIEFLKCLFGFTLFISLLIGLISESSVQEIAFMLAVLSLAGLIITFGVERYELYKSKEDSKRIKEMVRRKINTGGYFRTN